MYRQRTPIQQPIFRGPLAIRNLQEWYINQLHAITSEVTIAKLNLPYKLVSCNRRFTFKKACPYCGGDLTYTCIGWEEDENNLWTADSLDCDCSSQPDFDDPKLDEWMESHLLMPYIHQLPVDEAARKFINSKYRFHLK